MPPPAARAASMSTGKWKPCWLGTTRDEDNAEVFLCPADILQTALHGNPGRMPRAQRNHLLGDAVAARQGRKDGPGESLSVARHLLVGDGPALAWLQSFGARRDDSAAVRDEGQHKGRDHPVDARCVRVGERVAADKSRRRSAPPDPGTRPRTLRTSVSWSDLASRQKQHATQQPAPMSTRALGWHSPGHTSVP